METVQISNEVFYQPEYHLFFRARPYASETVSQALADLIRERHLTPVAARIDEWRSERSAFPQDLPSLLRRVRTVAVELTEACNMRCSYCYYSDTEELNICERSFV